MFQKDLLKGYRILVTGGGTGLGKAMSKKFLELGAELFICGRRGIVLEAACQELGEKTGGKTRLLFVIFACRKQSTKCSKKFGCLVL